MSIGNTLNGKVFQFFADCIKKSFWNLEVRDVPSVTVQLCAIFPALVLRLRFSRRGITSKTSCEIV